MSGHFLTFKVISGGFGIVSVEWKEGKFGFQGFWKSQRVSRCFQGIKGRLRGFNQVSLITSRRFWGFQRHFWACKGFQERFRGIQKRFRHYQIVSGGFEEVVETFFEFQSVLAPKTS